MLAYVHDDAEDSSRTPVQPAIERVSTAHLSFSDELRGLILRLEERKLGATRLLVPEGQRLVDAFEAWAQLPKLPDVHERNPYFLRALTFMEAAHLVLGDSRPAARRM